MLRTMTLGATRKDICSVVKLRKKHIRGVFIIRNMFFFPTVLGKAISFAKEQINNPAGKLYLKT